VTSMNADVQYQNGIVLVAVQALLGMVAPQLAGVSLQFDGDDLVIHFAVSELYDSLEDDVDDIVSDMEGQLWPATPEIATSTHVGSARVGWEGRDYRLIFLAK
jgi:hypothetical protein